MFPEFTDSNGQNSLVFQLTIFQYSLLWMAIFAVDVKIDLNTLNFPD